MALPTGRAGPRLTQARCELTREIQVVDASGRQQTIQIPDERALTVFVDRQELVTLMTLGQCPELLVLGYLLNQRLVSSADDIESISVDWSVQAAAVRTHGDLADSADYARRTARRVVTTGCGQGTVFGDLMDEMAALRLPTPEASRLRQSTLFAVLDTMRTQDNVYRRAGSVHGTALWRGGQQLVFVEDVGRHNAVDTIAGWMAMQGVQGADTLMYTTGRLSSEMVIKAARLGVPILVSRNGITAMGHDLAQQLGMTLLGRAANRRYICYSGAERLDLDIPA